MGLTQTKLHWKVLGGEWKNCLDRLEREKGKQEAKTFNPYGDLPLHLACYGGVAPPELIRTLIDAYPESIRMKNKAGRDPLELATINYRPDSPYRTEVLASLRWHRPDTLQDDTMNYTTFEGDLFSPEPPEQMYSTSSQCIICAEDTATVALIPCGHVCLCIRCVRNTMMQKGLCPIDRCEVKGLYRLQGDEIVTIHENVCEECNNVKEVVQPKESFVT